MCLRPNPALHCGMKAAVGAVALGCIRCLNSNDLFRREKRRSERKRRREEDKLRWMMGRKEEDFMEESDEEKREVEVFQ